MPVKTPDELKEQAQKIQLTNWPVHDCSMCGYRCGYIIDNDTVAYDSGCDCTGRYIIQPRDWEDLAYSYNLNQPENNPRISQTYLDTLNEIWKWPAPLNTTDITKGA